MSETVTPIQILAQPAGSRREVLGGPKAGLRIQFDFRGGFLCHMLLQALNQNSFCATICYQVHRLQIGTHKPPPYHCDVLQT